MGSPPKGSLAEANGSEASKLAKVCCQDQLPLLRLSLHLPSLAFLFSFSLATLFATWPPGYHTPSSPAPLLAPTKLYDQDLVPGSLPCHLHPLPPWLSYHLPPATSPATLSSTAGPSHQQESPMNRWASSRSSSTRPSRLGSPSSHVPLCHPNPPHPPHPSVGSTLTSPESASSLPGTTRPRPPLTLGRLAPLVPA